MTVSAHKLDIMLTGLRRKPGVIVMADAVEEKGVVRTPKVDFLYLFNGTKLDVRILEKHGPTAALDDAVVYAHIQDDLLEV